MGRRLQSLASALTGAVAAAGVMYYFDSGGRMGQMGGWGTLADTLFRGGRRGGLRGGHVPPRLLMERVRARLGRVVSHPAAVQVSIDEPHTVRLSGAVLAWEHEPLLRAVADLAGIARVRDELRVHESAEQLGEQLGERAGERAGEPRRFSTVPQPAEGGSTALRLLMALAGGSLVLGGTRRRGTLGAVGAAAAGGALLMRSVAQPRRRGSGHRGCSVEISRTLHVQAPVQSVYTALRQSDRLVAVLPPLRALRHRADGATQWTVSDPEGWRVEWSAVITELQPNRQIAWRSTDDSPLALWGVIWLERVDAHQTRLQLYVSCRMLPGRTGLALRRLAGTSSPGELAENLRRLRQYLEGSSPTDPLPGSAPLAAWMQPVGGRTH